MGAARQHVRGFGQDHKVPGRRDGAHRDRNHVGPPDVGGLPAGGWTANPKRRAEVGIPHPRSSPRRSLSWRSRASTGSGAAACSPAPCSPIRSSAIAGRPARRCRALATSTACRWSAPRPPGPAGSAGAPSRHRAWATAEPGFSLLARALPPTARYHHVTLVSLTYASLVLERVHAKNPHRRCCPRSGAASSRSSCGWVRGAPGMGRDSGTIHHMTYPSNTRSLAPAPPSQLSSLRWTHLSNRDP